MKNPEFEDNLDIFINGLSSSLGEKIKKKIDIWKPLLRLIITPGTLINIVHPFILFMSVTLLPHSFSTWIQVPLYLAFLFFFSKWCKYVARLKVGLKKDNNITMMPTMEICKENETETGEEKINFFHLRNPGSSTVSEKRNRSVDEDKEKPHIMCKPFITLGDITKEEVKQTEPVWLNESIRQFWINLKAALEDLIMNIIWPDIRKQIKEFPGNIDLEIYSLCLGMVAPRVENIKVRTDSESSNENLIVDICVTFASETSLDFRLKTDLNPKVSMRLESLILAAKLRIALIGIMPEMPMVKGFSVSLLDYPEMNWKLGGIGKIADMSWMDRIIKDLITEQISMFVLPNKITIPINCLGLPPAIADKLSEIDPNKFHSTIVPEPTGLVKVIIKEARNLPPSDYSSSITQPKMLFTSPLSFFKKLIPGKRSSDPYVKANIGSTSFQSKVCFNTLDPEYDFSCEILVECSKGQELKITFWDYDGISHNDLMGTKEEFLTNIVEKSFGYKTSPELTWYGIDGVVGGQCLMSLQWIPVKPVKEEVKSGVMAFSITRIRGSTVSMPDIKIRLLNGDDDAVTEEESECQTTEEWSSLPAFKESKEFKLGLMGGDEFDLFLLRGGMLRIKPQHKDMIIEVYDKLDRKEEIGKRIWKHQVPLSELATMCRSGQPVTFPLEKKMDKKPSLVNKTKQSLGYTRDTLTGKGAMDGFEEVKENEKMEIDLNLKFYSIS